MQRKQKKSRIAKLIDCPKRKQAKGFLRLLNQRELKSLDFNKAEYEYFIENCNFTDRQKQILDLRRKGSSIVSISLKLFLSERTVNREIKQIKNKILKVI